MFAKATLRNSVFLKVAFTDFTKGFWGCITGAGSWHWRASAR